MAIILVDFSQTVIAACFANIKTFNEVEDKKDTKNLIKHIVFNMILSWKRKFGGRVIIACDSTDYWRKQEFKYYKGHRKHHVDESPLDWEILYETLDELKIEIKETFPYSVLEVIGAEADDIIAVLCSYFQDNELEMTGLIEEPQEIVIISTDADFMQLQKYPSVKQWNNVTKKMMKCSDPNSFLQEHIAMGDVGDNIPSITTGDDWARMRSENVSTRAKPFQSARVKEFHKRGIDACINEEERRNWKRNELLIDFDMIPSRINTMVITKYLDSKPVANKGKVFNYLMSKRMKVLLPHAADF